MDTTFVVILAGDRASKGEEIARVTARDVARAATKAIALCVRAEFQPAASIDVRTHAAAFISFADGTCLYVFAPELAARHVEPVFVRWGLEPLPASC